MPSTKERKGVAPQPETARREGTVTASMTQATWRREQKADLREMNDGEALSTDEVVVFAHDPRYDIVLR